MVGAGLSRQTGVGHPADARPPSWGELAELLRQELHGGNPRAGSGSPTESVTARDCSRLAQQYKATFGQSALDSFLLSRVPDGEPGQVHKRLLRLPWADIFTTNWDTLLEKASRRISERTYDPVLSPADLATTVAPRIVKLHGSFPSSRPFVVTEEDYRTYPRQFAPLVNTVQQALMESIFLLVGFSGDDPNFLHWCGWVRDHLGPAAPRLYLAGLLYLDQPTRLMLEERGVIPIDLASEVAAAPTREERHQEAIEWILGSLEAGKTQEERWPFLPPRAPGSGAVGIASPVPPSGQPLEAPGAPSQGPDTPSLAEQVMDLARIWRHNRGLYPGWPILPFSKHRHLSGYTESWVEPILKALPSLKPADRLAVMWELIERIELLMEPMTPELAKATTETLDAAEELLAGDSELSDEATDEIHEARAALMLAMLTDARQYLDATNFDAWVDRVEPVVRRGTPAFHRLHHERCLWEWTKQDFAVLSDLLNAWQTGDADPMWSLRKAVLLVESGDVEGGQELALGTLQGVEHAWARDGRVRTAAPLGWALHWRRALNWAREWDERRKGEGSWQPDADLWARLVPYDSDARSDLDEYVQQTTEEQRDDSPWTFDLGRQNRIVLSSAAYRSFRSAWGVIRLLELSGIPYGLPGVFVLGYSLDKAARLIAPYAPAFAARLLLLGGSWNEKTLNAVLSQTHLARMSDPETSSLFDAARRARDHLLARWTPDSAEDDFVRGRVENALEVMSRCVVRHGGGSASELLEWALQYRRPRRWVDNQFWSCIASLWKRSWGAMDMKSRADAIPEILMSLIPEDALLTDRDPVALTLHDLPKIDRNNADEAAWTSCVRRICTGLGGNEYARELAFGRLYWMARNDLLADAEGHEVAIGLWRTVEPDSDGLPHIRRVDDWMYLVVPEPDLGVAEGRFRTKWIGREFKAPSGSTSTGDDILRNVAAAWNPDCVGDQVIALSGEEEDWLWSFVEDWLRYEASQRFWSGTSRGLEVPRLVDLLIHRHAPGSVVKRMAEAVAPTIGQRARSAEEWGSPENEHLMIAASAAFGGEEPAEAEHRIRLGARSPDERVSLASWNALRWWIRESARPGGFGMQRPSAEGVRDIGVAIGTSQQSGLIGALRAACAVYQSRNPEFVEAIHAQTIQGLRQLRSELDYRASVADRRLSDELPVRRHWCVWLAWAITHADKGDDDVVQSWIKTGDDDPLCVVRFVRLYAAHSAERDADGTP